MNSTSRLRPVHRPLAAVMIAPALALGLTGCGSTDVEWNADEVDQKMTAFMGDEVKGLDFVYTRGTDDLDEGERMSDEVHAIGALNIAGDAEKCGRLNEALIGPANDGLQGVSTGNRDHPDAHDLGSRVELLVFEDEDARTAYSDALAAHDDACTPDPDDETTVEIDGEEVRVLQTEHEGGILGSEPSKDREMTLASGNIVLHLDESMKPDEGGSLDEYAEKRKESVETLLDQLRD